MLTALILRALFGRKMTDGARRAMMRTAITCGMLVSTNMPVGQGSRQSDKLPTPTEQLTHTAAQNSR